MKTLVFCILTLLATPLYPSPHAFFSPPDKWEIANPESYAPSVSICFVKKGRSHFPVSINLASERTSASLDEYVNAVQKIHEQDKRTSWKELGTLNTRAGTATLTQIDTTTELGPARMLQLLFLKNGQAYVMTAAALKEEVKAHYGTFIETFKSFTITSNLLDSIVNMQRKVSLTREIERIQSSKDWSNKLLTFQKRFMKQFSDLGTHWQLLVLSDIREACERQERAHEK